MIGHIIAGLIIGTLIIPPIIGLFPHKQHYYELGCINCGISYTTHQPCMIGQDFRQMCLVCGRKQVTK